LSALTQSQKIIRFLQGRPLEKFNARQIAEAITQIYAEDYREKRQNPRFENDKAFIAQIVAEIGATKERVVKDNPHVLWQDKPRPRVYWYDPTPSSAAMTLADEDEEKSFCEHDLYPILMGYLKSEFKLYCQRIDEKRSTNSRGAGGNQWLHPDIVAMQAVDQGWHELVRSCVQQGVEQRVRLWSFEVKKELTSSNARKSFFQAVSNSSWANEGYLVATAIASSAVEQELRMLSALHGIGVIVLNPENPSESDMVLPAQPRPSVDWQSINRIVVENTDFKDYIELVSMYYQTGIIRAKDWNKICNPSPIPPVFPLRR